MGDKEIKPSLFAGDIIMGIGNPTESAKNATK